MSVDPKAAKKALQAADAEKAMAEYRAQQAAVDANTERLRALRLAREAALATVAPTDPTSDLKPRKKSKAKK